MRHMNEHIRLGAGVGLSVWKTGDKELKEIVWLLAQGSGSRLHSGGIVRGFSL